MADDGMRLSEQNVSADGSEAFAHSPCWDAIDAVVCINLDARKDRWESFCNTLRGKLPQEKLHRVSAVVGRELPGYGEAPWFTERTGERSSYWAGVAGCTLSHAKALRLAQQQGWRNVLILEDDVIASLSCAGLLLVRSALSRLSGPFFLYLGYADYRPRGILCEQTDGAALWRIDGSLTTHAYLVPAEMYQLLLDALPSDPESVWEWVSRHRAIDTFYRDELSRVRKVPTYAVLPLMFHQSDLASDLVNCGKKAIRSLVEEPRSCGALSRFVCGLISPLRRLKIYLNSVRTHRRAVTGGFPGFRKNRPRP